MAQEQMRRAAELIKRGEKRQAGQILRGILRQDQDNAQGWWLLSLTQEDRDKAIRCLERVLAIDPNHAGAKKRLAALRPEEVIVDDGLPSYVPAQDGAGTASTAKSNNDDDYWAKLREAPKQRTKQRTWVDRIGRSLMIRFAFLVIFGIGAIVFAAVQDNTLQDINGNTPVDVAMRYEEAYWIEDYGVMVNLTCPSFISYTEELWQSSYTYANGKPPSDLSADMSDVRPRRIRLEPPLVGNAATVSFTGSVTWRAFDEDHFYSYDDDITDQGGDVWIGHNLRRIDGEWLICDGPDVINF